jgi:small subunit ribosomal protein S9
MTKTDKYFESVGRRKRATARVRLFTSDKQEFTVNEMPANKYFKTDALQSRIRQALTTTNNLDKFKVSAQVSGSGVSSQADAITLGVARALLEFDDQLRPALRAEDLLKRDPRIKERKKPGLRKARKSPQWSKR